MLAFNYIILLEINFLILWLFENFFIFVKNKYIVDKSYLDYNNSIKQDLYNCVNSKSFYLIFLSSK